LGPKWELTQNVGMKSAFSPINKACSYLLIIMSSFRI